jgi:hypothetical protein
VYIGLLNINVTRSVGQVVSIMVRSVKKLS